MLQFNFEQLTVRVGPLANTWQLDTAACDKLAAVVPRDAHPLPSAVSPCQASD